MKKTFITKIPDKAGAFLGASKVISGACLNITRVSYNKAVDTHTLFIDVSGEEQQIERVLAELEKLGYLTDAEPQAKVILLEFRLPDKPGTLLPVLEVISSYDFNISYISSQENGTGYQLFKMGLFIDSADDIKSFLESALKLCEVKIIDYDKSEKILDNTVFYLSYANEISGKLCLLREATNALIADSNLIMQMLDEKNEPPYKTFEYIGKFADSLAGYKGVNFNVRITHKKISDMITLHLIEPPCGSNTYIIECGGRLLFVDCGFACYRDEMNHIFSSMLPNFNNMHKDIIITHTDIDHCGLLDIFDNIYLSGTGYDNFLLENNGEPNFRERNPSHAPYCRISGIMSGYIPPCMDKLHIIGRRENNGTPLIYIGSYDFCGMKLDIYEGNGGHVNGEVIIVSCEYKIVFTGDIMVNIKSFSKEQAEFNKLAPYLMTSVNMDSEKSKQERYALSSFIDSDDWLVCCGHGAIIDKREK